MHQTEHLHVVVAKIKNVKSFFLRFPGATSWYQQKCSQYLFSFVEKQLIVFRSQSLWRGKESPNDPHKEVKNKPEV